MALGKEDQPQYGSTGHAEVMRQISGILLPPTTDISMPAIYSQVITTQPGVVQHVHQASACPLVYSIFVAVLCGLMSPITLVCTIPAIVCAALVSHYSNVGCLRHCLHERIILYYVTNSLRKWLL